jgi:hypothetical protein
MADDMMISMGADEGAPDTGAPDTEGGGVFDQALADMEGTLAGEGGSAPEPPQNRPQDAPPSFNRGDAYKTAVKKQQRTWAQRQREKNAELERLREVEAAQGQWQSQIAETVQHLKELAKLQTGGGAEEIPDPVLDPAGFAAFIQKGGNSALEAQIRPVMERLQGITGRLEEADQQRAASEAHQRQIEETTRGFEEEIEQYREMYPELEHGAEDRILGGMDILAEVFTERLGWGDVGQRMAHTIASAVARTAQMDGTLGVMAVDQFFTGLMESAASRILEHYAAMGYELPPFAALAMEGAEGGSPVPAPRPAPPSPAQREIARQEAVRQRGASVNSARPRQPARGTTAPTSKAAVLALDYRGAGRDVDWNAVMKTALQESGGNRARAQAIYQEACKLVDAA